MKLKPVPDSDDRYIVSSEGIIWDMDRSCPVGVWKTPNGYACVRLVLGGQRRNFTLGNIVARVFLGECPYNKCLRWKNGNREDCRLKNLAYLPLLNGSMFRKRSTKYRRPR